MAKIHIIIAHPSSDSYNYALLNAATCALSSAHTVTVTDIYQYLASGHAAVQPYGSKRDEAMALQIHQEQKIIADSELTIIQFPLYWFSFPGLLKNYWEQVLEPGFAYPGKFENSPLNDGRKLMFSITTQSTAEDFTDQGLCGSMHNILYPMTVAFRFVGFSILEPFVAYNVTDQKQEDLQRGLQEFAKYAVSAAEAPKIWVPL